MDSNSNDKLLQLVLRLFDFPEGYWFDLMMDVIVYDFWDGLISNDACEKFADWVRMTAEKDLDLEVIWDMDEILLLVHILRRKEMPVKLRTREMAKRINLRVETTVDRLLEEGEQYLFSLNRLKITDETDEELRVLVQCLPELLHRKAPVMYEAYDFFDDEEYDEWYDCEDVLPIQNTILELILSAEQNINVIRLIPILAEEGMKHNVGGKGMRGGLLCQGPLRYDEDGDEQLDYTCVLKHLVMPMEFHWDDDQASKNEVYDAVCLDALKRLREMKLLRKNDVRKYRLLSATFQNFFAFKRHTFEYLANLAPEALKARCSCCKITLLQKAVGRNISDEQEYRNPQVFKTVLKACLKHYPYRLSCFLFQRRDEHRGGGSAIRDAYKTFGEEEAWKTIKECLDQTKEVLDLSPNTNTYPFMFTAKSATARSLNLVYYLLRRDPNVIKCALDINTPNKKPRHK